MKFHRTTRGSAPIVAGLASLIVAFGSTRVDAADLGGDCCADLEERIAELEATTARKGNRKVSLTVSGHVAQEITYFDDGGESNVYIHGLGPTQTSNIRFNGQATISPGWTAGYTLRIQELTTNAFGRSGADALDQNNDSFGSGLNVQFSYWYLQSKDYGKVQVGRQPLSSKSIAMFTDLSGTQLVDNYTFLDGFPQFIVRSGGNLAPGNLTWGQFGFCYSQNAAFGGDCNGIVQNGVRYDTPAYKGFSLSASWGEDDVWEVGGRYAGEVAGFKLSFGVGYSSNNDENAIGAIVTNDKDSEYFQIGGYAQHLATGLFVHAAYGEEDNNDTVLLNGRTALDSEHYYVKAGVRQKWMPLGHTIVYGDYARYDDQLGPAALALGATSSELQRYGGGIAQEIDAAAMLVYLKYQRYDVDVYGLSPAIGRLESIDFVSAGAVVNF